MLKTLRLSLIESNEAGEPPEAVISRVESISPNLGKTLRSVMSNPVLFTAFVAAVINLLTVVIGDGKINITINAFNTFVNSVQSPTSKPAEGHAQNTAKPGQDKHTKLPNREPLSNSYPISESKRRKTVMAQQYKPGETVPRDGRVECKQKNGTQDNVKKDTKFAPCLHWGDHDGKGCTWEYIS
jgi:hypothetical protein